MNVVKPEGAHRHKVSHPPREKRRSDIDRYRRAQPSPRLLRAVQLVGVLEQVLKSCVAYSADRTQLGRLIRAFQATEGLLVEIAAESAAATAATDAAMRHVEASD